VAGGLGPGRAWRQGAIAISICFDDIGEMVIEFANPSEPTSALDEETMKKVEKTLLSLLPSRVSHYRVNVDLY
jgi:ABC-type polar amino acid transport system ATPase subunit